MMPYPPRDCDGREIKCGDSIHFMELQPGGVQRLRLMQIKSISQPDGFWVLDGLTADGMRCTIHGVQHVRLVPVPVPQIFEAPQ